MFSTLKDLFDSFISPAAADAATTAHQLQLATAVLLVEVMRADSGIDDAERVTAMAALRERFALADDEIARLLELATHTARESYDYQRFTAQLNRTLDLHQKVQIVEYLWQVAYADGRLQAHEEHVMRKIADLLYLPHADYITAKLRARDAAGVR